jgi:hypothetical protein
MDEPQSGNPADVVREDLHRMTRELHDNVKSTPNHLASAPTLTRLGNSRRAVEKAIKEGRHVQPEVFARLLALAPGFAYEEKIQYVQRYTAALMALEADKALSILKHILQRIGHDGETVTIVDFETQITFRSRTINISRNGSASMTGEEAQREFAVTQQAMAHSATFGWITSVRPGFQITAPSRAICALLDLGYDELNGSFLLCDPLRTRLQNILSNFGEWALVIAMQANSALDTWRSDPEYAHSAAEVGSFFEWLRWYVQTDYKNVAEQVERAPATLIDGNSSRDDLRICLAAALGDAQWPVLNIKRHNTMRMYVNRHRMMPAGIARFEKTARPFYSNGHVIGYEVTWNAEYADERANTLMRSVLAEVGLIEDSQADSS